MHLSHLFKILLHEQNENKHMICRLDYNIKFDSLSTLEQFYLVHNTQSTHKINNFGWIGKEEKEEGKKYNEAMTTTASVTATVIKKQQQFNR